ncbi:MAG: branched-chain amino acid aminotransferase [Bacilli bacterium]
MISIQTARTERTLPLNENELGFSKYFTDHMFVMHYTPEQGWYAPTIKPYQDFTISPASKVFHYGQAIFEGLKAYRNPNGEIKLFRPEENFKRMNVSAERLCIPPIDEHLVLEGLKQLIEVDSDWVPSTHGTSLYIRPTIIATDDFLGINASNNYIFYIIMSPVGAYYANGFTPTKIYVEDEFVRAVRGGTGAAKTAGNYAASMLAAKLAQQKGYDQVLWLDGIERKYIEEVGAMNVFFCIDDEIITPAIGGSILSGITRKSTIELAQSLGYKVVQRAITLEEVVTAARTGTLKEAFGTGTAASISPIGVFGLSTEKIIVNNNEVGPITQKLYDTLVGIQYGTIEDSFGWVTNI